MINKTRRSESLQQEKRVDGTSESKMWQCRKRNPISVIWLLLYDYIRHNVNFLTNKNSLDISQFVTRVLSEFTEPNRDEERVILQ